MLVRYWPIAGTGEAEIDPNRTKLPLHRLLLSYLLAATRCLPLSLKFGQRNDAIFDIEREINGCSADGRLAARRERVAPLVTDLEAWIRAQRAKLSRHSDVGKR